MAEYEFDHEENLIFVNFNYRAAILGGLVLLLGLVSFANAIIMDGGFIEYTSSIFLIIIASAFYFPTFNFNKIVETKGTDITELMNGIKKFVIGWGVMTVILVIYRIIMIIDLFV